MHGDPLVAIIATAFGVAVAWSILFGVAYWVVGLFS